MPLLHIYIDKYTTYILFIILNVHFYQILVELCRYGTLVCLSDDLYWHFVN